MQPAAFLKKLISEPPMRERLLWHGLLRPGPRDLGDRALVAGAFAALFWFGGLVGLLAVAVGSSMITDQRLLLLASGLSLLLSTICLLGYRRLPRRFFQLAAAGGTGITVLAACSAAPGSEPVFAPFLGFVLMLCLLFMRPIPAALQGAITLAAYATLLYAREAPFATQLLLSSIAMIGPLGVLIAVIRTRTTRVADRLSDDSLSDPLTRLPNRRSFDQRFELELERAQRGGGPLSLVLCDLDHFKRVNDELGHGGGDAVLRRVGQVIGSGKRAIDLAARIGGEEFALILPDADAEQAAVAAERLRNSIADTFATQHPTLTASCGIASTEGAEADGPMLFSGADRALYRAKRAGRNCTAIVGPDGVEIVAGGSAIGRLRSSLTG